MPWVYLLSLNAYIDAGVVQTDWEETISGNAAVIHDHGGVTISGSEGVIVSQRNAPEYHEMADLPYIESITEYKEIPSRGTAKFDPPIELGQGFKLIE